MSGVFVAGVGMTRFAKQPNRGLKSLVSEAVEGAMDDAGIDPARVEAAYFANAVAGSITGQEMIAGEVTLHPLGLHNIPVFNIENACASASSAFHLAWQAIAAGACDVALAIGAEKLSHADKAQSFASLAGAVDVDDGITTSSDERSLLMDIYAAEARRYMELTGATVHDLARVVVKNQFHGSMNPLAQYGNAGLTVEEVLADREIAWPLTLRMCSPISDGAAATILVSDRFATGRQRSVRIAATVVRANAEGGSSLAEAAAHAAYDRAGIGPQDVDVAEVHDAAAAAELVLYEQLGFAEQGEGPSLIRSGATRLGGRIPVNVSGGLLARGHPIGATGLAQICELVTQLRADAHDRQVAGAKVALAENGGGYLKGDNAVAVVTVLTR